MGQWSHPLANWHVTHSSHVRNICKRGNRGGKSKYLQKRSVPLLTEMGKERGRWKRVERSKAGGGGDSPLLMITKVNFSLRFLYLLDFLISEICEYVR